MQISSTKIQVSNPEILEEHIRQLLGQTKSTVDKIYQREWRAIKPIIIREIASILVQSDVDNPLNYDDYMEKINKANDAQIGSDEMGNAQGVSLGNSLAISQDSAQDNDTKNKYDIFDIDKKKLRELSDKIEDIENKLAQLSKKGRPSKKDNPFLMDES